MEITITMKIDNEELKDLLGLQNEKPKKVRRESNFSPYARVFDETCTGWTRNSEMNKVFLLQQQAYANEKLKRYGYLFLNEVYDMLGIPRTRAGQVMGWLYDEEYLFGNNVDFGLFSEHNRRFVNGLEKTVVLDFNVDGNILGYFDEEEP